MASTVGLFGDKDRVDVQRLRAWFGEERLPLREGWKAGRKRRMVWWVWHHRSVQGDREDEEKDGDVKCERQE